MSMPVTDAAPLRAKMMLKIPVPQPESRTDLPATSAGREEQGPVLFRGLVFRNVFRPDDVVESADAFLVHGHRCFSKKRG